MRCRVLGAYGGELGPYRNSAFLLDDCVLIDAGGASGALGLAETHALRAIVLTHAHADHIASLPFLLDARIGCETLDVYALRETVAALRIHIFNNKIWPDFERIPDPRRPLVRFHEIEREKPFSLERLRFTAVAVDHTVPTVGYFVEDERAAVLFSADTGPTRRIWELAHKVERLRSIVLEVSFPERLERIAQLSRHLSTQSVRAELEKLPHGVPVLLNHLKPACLEELHRELEPVLRAGKRDVKLIVQDRTYDFA
jgi:ribonuclease BN (tRNA processing enzyme)